MSIDYNALAESYDLTRTANISIIHLFAAELPLDGKTILDFGCGTGNFALALKALTSAEVYGVEPSEGMREKALAKGLDARPGDHSSIPFADAFFDFVYMTDVIHHVPDLSMMFAAFGRVLKPGGLVCILTESHRQLETRFWIKHFPTAVAAEKKRYPDIPDIIQAAQTAGLKEHKVITTDADSEFTISQAFVTLAENSCRILRRKTYEHHLYQYAHASGMERSARRRRLGDHRKQSGRQGSCKYRFYCLRQGR
ncbi:MAG: class I SAM-dependent methyltransferase [Firmicutes bacterium]|nr:class I SAM-dependent methyltransferase [Bacillota bacterium]